jgi:hypothetical protein
VADNARPSPIDANKAKPAQNPFGPDDLLKNLAISQAILKRQHLRFRVK